MKWKDPFMPDISLGIYEKALPRSSSWSELFFHVSSLGFDFIDLSIDESPERLARLTLTDRERMEIVKAAKEQTVAIGGICLSAHRKYSLGSPIARNEQQAKQILMKGIEFAKDVGASIVQIAGYYTFYDKHDEYSYQRFINNLREGVNYAARTGVVLGIENVDGEDITTLEQLMNVLQEINSPWLQAYPDVGNCAFNGDAQCLELETISGRIAALHVKDVLPGKPRYVHFGEGITDFDSAFEILKKQQYAGRVMLEMWNDITPDPYSVCLQAKEFITAKLSKQGFKIAVS